MNITIPIADKILTVSEWVAFNPSVSEYKFPVIFRIADGCGKLYFDGYTHYYLASTYMNSILVSAANSAKKPEAAPNPGISELTLLKAISLAQKPELIKDML